MKVISIRPEPQILREYLQDLICDAGSPQEADVLVDLLMALQHAALPRLETPSPRALNVKHRSSGD
jgi:hypothetical protein